MSKVNRRIILLTMLFATSSIAYADAYDDTTFNVGVECSFINRPSYNSNSNTAVFLASANNSKLALTKNEPGINVNLGARFTETWGGQVGFSFVSKAKASVPLGNATNKISNIYADLLGFINIATDLDMMGLLGYGALKSNPSITGVQIYNQTELTKRKLGFRFGGGLQYNFVDAWSSRLILVYQKGNSAFLRTLISVSIGIIYTFQT